MTVRAFNQVPVRFDSVEHDLAKFKQAVLNVPETATPVLGDFYSAALHKIVVQGGIGTIKREPALGKYNFLWLDLCTHASMDNIKRFADVVQHGTQKKAMAYITVQISAAHIQNGYRGFAQRLGIDWKSKQDPTAMDIARRVKQLLANEFRDRRLSSKLRPVLEIVYTGVDHALMLTLGFSKGSRQQRFNMISANWTQESKALVDARMQKLQAFLARRERAYVEEKQTAVRQTKRQQRLQEKAELERQRPLLRETIKILSDAGWATDQIGETLALDNRTVGSYLAQYSGRHGKVNQYKVPKAKVTVSWVEQRLKELGIA